MLRDLHALVKRLVRLACSANAPPFASEAVIVNFYKADDKLCGHVDDAERTFDAPIVSISLGLEGVFLLGGRSKDVAPTPILVRSGDVVIMGGEARFAYHGVPRVFADSMSLDANATNALIDELVGSNATTTTTAATTTAVDDRERLIWRRVVEFMATTRINVNVRQVNEWAKRREPTLDDDDDDDDDANNSKQR